MSYVVAKTKYKNYLTVPDCGVYVYSGGIPYPLYYSLSLNYVFNYKAQTVTVRSSDGIDGTDGKGTIAYIDLHNLDYAYLIHPNYGLIVWNTWNSWSDETRVGTDSNLNYYNKTLTPKYVKTTGNNQGDYCQIYYKGVELRNLQDYDDDYY